MPGTRLLAIALVLALTIISTVFAYLTLKSPEWSTQALYPALSLTARGDGSNNINPIFHVTRSPFYKCGVPQVYLNQSFKINCTWYKPYGYNETSCRTNGEIGLGFTENVKANGTLGTAQECQNVHYAGNLQIATCVFVTLGLIASLGLAIAAFIPVNRRKHEKGNEAGLEQSPKPAGRSSPLLDLALSLVLLMLGIGIALQILAQFFGILGLVITATPDTENLDVQQPEPNYAVYTSDDWIIGEGLARYATVTWVSALAALLIARVTFSTSTKAKMV